MLEHRWIREQLLVVFVELDLIEPQADEREVQRVLPVHPGDHRLGRLRVGEALQVLEDGDEKQDGDGNVRVGGAVPGIGSQSLQRLAELVPTFR